MPENPDFISQEQYDQYTAKWIALLNSGDDNALEQAFQAPGVARITFLPFSLDQILALVTATGVHTIKARLLFIPDAIGQACVSVTLFAVDANGQRLSEYYIPTQAAATTTQPVHPSTGPSTQIPPEVALGLLTDWVDAAALTTTLFTTAHGPLHGFNFEVGTFQDPLAGALPYTHKCLFLNLGLGTEAGVTLSALVVYIGQLGSRTQGSLRGVPDGNVFFDRGDPCPPSA